MNYKNIISFFVVFILKETLSFDSMQSSYQYDITKLLDQWFAKIFKIDVELAPEVREAFGYAEEYKLEEVEYKLTHEVNPFENKFIFKYVNFCRLENDKDKTSYVSKISYMFPENKISMFVEKLQISVGANLQAQQSTPYLHLSTTLHFHNFTLSATKLSKNENFSIDVSYDYFYTHDYVYNSEIHWTRYESNRWSSAQVEYLNQEVKPALVAMLCENIKGNERSSLAFNTLFSSISKTRTDLVSIHPDILQKKQKYYYLIPKILFYRFSLISIRIEGLPNIESLCIDKLADFFTHTLLVKGIRGNMFLDYGPIKGAPQPLELYFELDHLTIFIGQERNCAHAEARYFSVNSGFGPVTHRQATVIMQSIESAILSSIMPSKTAWRLCDTEAPIDKLKTSDTSDWETIKETYKKWIPFN